MSSKKETSTKKKANQKETILNIRNHDENGPDMQMCIDWAVRKSARVVRTMVGDQEFLLDKGDLWRAVFMLSSADEQLDLIPSRLRKARNYKKRFTLKAEKDIKKGDLIIVNVPFTIPEDSIPNDIIKKEKKALEQISKKKA